MNTSDRDDIHLISRHSNLSESSADRLLRERVYSSARAWQQFLRLFFISLGVGFSAAGIIFFFAYNWADLHKFAKIGLIEGLLVLATLAVLLLKIEEKVKHILLTGAAVLVGVLFAVFGQIYQTGANAYDFFQGWTVFISLWVLVSNFAPLWLIYLALLQTTLILYAQQVAFGWSAVFLFTLLFLLNGFVLVFSLALPKYKAAAEVPRWFTDLLALAAVSFATLGICMGIFSALQPAFLVLLIITAVGYAAGIWYGLSGKRGFYLSVIPFSLIIITSALLVYVSVDRGMLSLISLFIIGSVTLVIKNLLNLQKKWTNG